MHIEQTICVKCNSLVNIWWAGSEKDNALLIAREGSIKCGEYIGKNCYICGECRKGGKSEV